MVSDSVRPKKEWTLDQLAAYALQRVATIKGFAKKTVEQVYLFGESLFYVKQIKKEGKEWIRWLDDQPYSRTAALQAVKFYEKVGTDIELLSDLTLTEAKIVVGVIKPPVRKEKPDKKETADNKETVDNRIQGGGETPESGETAPLGRQVGGEAFLQSESAMDATADLLGKTLNLLLEVEKRGITVEHMKLMMSIQEVLSRITAAAATKETAA